MARAATDTMRSCVASLAEARALEFVFRMMVIIHCLRHARAADGTSARSHCMDNPGMSAAASHNKPSRPVLIAGGGIGGMATALTLHQIGVPCIVFESVRSEEHTSGLQSRQYLVWRLLP